MGGKGLGLFIRRLRALGSGSVKSHCIAVDRHSRPRHLNSVERIGIGPPGDNAFTCSLDAEFVGSGRVVSLVERPFNGGLYYQVIEVAVWELDLECVAGDGSC